MQGTRSHPDDATTAAYLDGVLADRERDRFETHLVRCDACRAGIVLLRAGDDEPVAVPAAWVARAREIAPRPTRRSDRSPGWVVAAAAAIFLAGGLALRIPAPPASSPTYRSEGETALTPLHPAAGSRVAAGTLRFRWSPAPGADRYRVTLRTATGETLGTIVVPGDQLELVWEGVAPHSATLLWTVEALSLDRVIGISRPTPFAVR